MGVMTGLSFWGTLKVLLAVWRSAFDLLTEASAEVGEWYLRRRGVKQTVEIFSRLR